MGVCKSSSLERDICRHTVKINRKLEALSFKQYTWLCFQGKVMLDLKKNSDIFWNQVFVLAIQNNQYCSLQSSAYLEVFHLSGLLRNSRCILNTLRNLPFRSNNNKKSQRVSSRLWVFAKLWIKWKYCHTWSELPQDQMNVLPLFFSDIAAHVYCCGVCCWKTPVSEKKLFYYGMSVELQATRWAFYLGVQPGRMAFSWHAILVTGHLAFGPRIFALLRIAEWPYPPNSLL